jgi:hypothetical protein
MPPRRVVLTGGPGGGKSTLMRELRSRDPGGRNWALLPEAAPPLLGPGLERAAGVLQPAVVRLQATLEELYDGLAPAGAVVVCHRGTLDALPYWLLAGEDESAFYERTGRTREEHLARYHAVLHLQTAAVGAGGVYTRGPSARRRETPAEAATLDDLCVRAWRDHPRYLMLGNAGSDWDGKAARAVAAMQGWIAGEDG